MRSVHGNTVKQGFEQLLTWVDRRRIVPVEWIAVWLTIQMSRTCRNFRCDTVVSRGRENFILPDNSEGVIVRRRGGECHFAVARG